MQLGENEFTTSSLISHLTKVHTKKISGEDFNHSDVAQYCIRGYLPYRYGGNSITIKYQEGIKIITLGLNEVKQPKKVEKKERKVKKKKNARRVRKN